jgi:hypothetical protein
LPLRLLTCVRALPAADFASLEDFEFRRTRLAALAAFLPVLSFLAMFITCPSAHGACCGRAGWAD